MITINEPFICTGCKKEIGLAVRTCRNHCPYCFTSRHVDGDIPGDRNTNCGGNMYPRAYEWKNSQVRIFFECTICHKHHWNKQATDDNIAVLPGLIEQYRRSF